MISRGVTYLSTSLKPVIKLDTVIISVGFVFQARMGGDYRTTDQGAHVCKPDHR